MQKKVPLACLFDLDGTILDSRMCGVTAFVISLGEMYGWENPLEGVLVAGRTDRKIFFDIYRKFSGDIPVGEAWTAEVEKFKRLYLQHLESFMKEKRPFLCPGFPALLDSIPSIAGMEPGLATGNFKEGAEIKLKAGGIDPARFAFGSFGSETESRPELLRLAVTRAESLAGKEVRAVVIGDTPEDYKAARKIEALCALVATGPYSHEQLRALNPDFMAEDLSDPSPFLNWLGSVRSGFEVGALS